MKWDFSWRKKQTIRKVDPVMTCRCPIPTSGQLSESEGKQLRLRVKELLCDTLNGMRIRQSLMQPYIPQTGTWTLGRCSGWEPEFRDCGAVLR